MQEGISTAKNQPKVLNAWAMYYWANSVFPLVITSTLFPIYFESSTQAAHGSTTIPFLGFEFINTALYAYALSFSFLVIALISPVLSGIADYSGLKKHFLIMFTLLGAAACSALFYFDGSNTMLGVSAFVLASVGFSGSHIFYNAYLPQIATNDKMDILSAKGFSLGYFGSSLLLIFCLILLFYKESFGFSTDGQVIRTSFLLTGLWWIGFALLPFYRLPNATYRKKVTLHTLGLGFRELKDVWMMLRSMPNLKLFLLSFFIFSMGLQTVLFVAAMFGHKEMKIESDQLILSILAIQFVAIAGAYFFAWLCSKIGNIYSLTIALMIWIGICTAAYFITEAWHFFLLAAVVGLVMGGIQSVSRSTFTKLLPERKDHNAFYSFYEVTEKVAIAIGTASYGMIEEITGSMRNSIFALITFFIIGLLVLQLLKNKRVLQAD